MVRRADISDLNTLTDLACKLWPDNEREVMHSDLAEIMENTDGVFFLAEEERRVQGFAQCQLRRDYVEGTESSPVGYLEGIFVEEFARGSGVAKALLAACEHWSTERGCREFASDCELTNELSLAFHLALGFREANRIICFTKKL